jgi:dihydroxy-acid dehydratase
MALGARLPRRQPRGLTGIPATHPAKAEAAVEAGRIAMELVRDDVRPSQLLTREAFENAIAASPRTGGSTNGVLHLLAIAREAGVDCSLDDFDTIAARTPIVADLKPAALTSPPTCTRRAASALVARELVRRRPRARRRGRVDGRTLGEVGDRASSSGRARTSSCRRTAAQADAAGSRSCAARSRRRAAS